MHTYTNIYIYVCTSAGAVQSANTFSWQRQNQIFRLIQNFSPKKYWRTTHSLQQLQSQTFTRDSYSSWLIWFVTYIHNTHIVRDFYIQHAYSLWVVYVVQYKFVTRMVCDLYTQYMYSSWLIYFVTYMHNTYIVRDCYIQRAYSSWVVYTIHT